MKKYFLSHSAVVVTLCAALGGRDSSNAVSPVNATAAPKSRPQKGSVVVPQSVEVSQEELSYGSRTAAKRFFRNFS